MEDKKRIYVDIQSLLDIRQSALCELLGEQEALAFVNSEPYYNRNRDQFEGVDSETFDKCLETTHIALKRATVTYVEVILNSKISSLERLNVFNSDNKQLEILLNIYPFKLDEASANVLRDGLFSKLTTPVPISVIYEPLEGLSPVFIKQHNIVEFFCYEGAKWLALHTESLGKIALRETRLQFPAIGRGELTPKDLKELKRLGFNDIYQYTEFLFSTVTRMNFLPVGFYCNIVIGTLLLDRIGGELKKEPPQEPDKKV